jgi:hypothetical protein
MDVKTKVRGDLTTIVWRERRNVTVLTNMHSVLPEGYFCDQHGKAVKLAIL